MAVVGHVPASPAVSLAGGGLELPGCLRSSVITGERSPGLGEGGGGELDEAKLGQHTLPSSERTKVANACRSLADSLSGMLL